jgi:2-polyprenyl-3-methyl-5-hydroxy-6-metoxy-1,4-benzoquinol methylase
MNYYEIKEKDYFTGTRHDIISLLPKKSDQKVLEIGAGGGDTLVYIKKNNLAQEVVGFELFKIPNSNQENELIDSFIFGDIENENIPVQENYFDVIILADVLEHLIDPWAAFNKIIKYLKPSGQILVSLPNIREINTLLKVFFLGDFRYNDGGVLDKTHLRFFCKKNMKKLLETGNTKIVKSFPSFKLNKQQKRRHLYNLISFGLFENFLTFQFLFVIEKR